MRIKGFDPYNIYFNSSKKQAEKLGAKYVKSQVAWAIPLNAHSLKEAYQITKDERLRDVALSYKKGADKLKELKNKTDVEGDPRLRPYQRVDVNFLKKRKFAGIFNEQRTGKTPTAITLLKELNCHVNLVVVPASLVLQWEEEIKKWDTEAEVNTLNLTKKKRQQFYNEIKKRIQSNELTRTYIVVSYETLNADVSDLHEALSFLNYELCLIADEAHRLTSLHKGKNASQQSKSFLSISRLADYRYLLTGTPSRNNGHDVWGLLHVLDPIRWSSYWHFIDRYYEKKQGFFGETVIGKCKRPEELQEILNLISTQRKRKDVMKWLPEKQYKTLKIPFTAKQRKAYLSVLNTFEYEEEGEMVVDAPGQLAQLTRLSQICLAPSVLGINAPSAKVKAIKEWLKDNENEQVVIFSRFTSALKELAKELEREKVGMIHGEMDTNERQNAVKRFQQGKTRVLLANIIAAGTGITLDAAATAIFLDRSYVPIENEQAEDRIIPVSKERNHSVTIIDMVMNDSVEERIQYLLKQKKNVIEVINNYGLKEVLK